MALSPAQYATLKAAINADPVLAAYPLSTDGYIDLAARLNTELASPDFYVWKENLTWAEIRENGFAWVEVDSLSAGKARISEWMWGIQSGGTIPVNPSKVNIRAGIEECWKGTTDKLAVQAVIFSHCRKLATRIAKIFAGASVAPPTPSGNLGSATNVATALVTGVTADDVATARNLP